jgi:hypothetical protein
MAMKLNELQDEDLCVECGASLSVEIDRAFACGPDTFLCYACAERRGGIFDEDEDRWTLPPDVESLPDERRPHA